MRLTLTIDCENAAFHEHDDGAEREPCLTTREELGRLLASVAGSVHAGQESGTIRDGNGNTVGGWRLEESPEAARA